MNGRPKGGIMKEINNVKMTIDLIAYDNGNEKRIVKVGDQEIFKFDIEKNGQDIELANVEYSKAAHEMGVYKQLVDISHIIMKVLESEME